MHVKKSDLVRVQLVWILITMNHYVSSRQPRTWALAHWLKPVTTVSQFSAEFTPVTARTTDCTTR